VRVNTLKADAARVEQQFREAGIGVRRAALAPDGLHLDRRVDASSMPAFREGWFEMQDEGSQLLSLLLDPHPGERIIDACAGAGGKSLHLAALMGNRGEIVAADIDRQRVRELDVRMRRAGVTIISTIVTDGGAPEVDPADAVLIDAPCSGTGTLRRNPGLRLRLQEDRIRELLDTQRSILDRACRLVRPGGRMLYATCSLLRAENETQADGFLARHPGFSPRALPAVPFAGSIAVPGRTGEALLLPHRHSTDGFFAALFERRAAD
jgi:16S rRNA (cytosine967-C5)-methyltransferase